MLIKYLRVYNNYGCKFYSEGELISKLILFQISVEIILSPLSRESVSPEVKVRFVIWCASFRFCSRAYKGMLKLWSQMS